MKPRKPNALVAGFPRCGSTFLYYVLRQHPDLFIPSIKEINYFNKDHFFLADPEILNPRYFKSKKWYYNFFRTDKKIVMDFSIISALDVGSAQRVKKELGDIKILFVTRDKEKFKNSVKTMMAQWDENYDWKEDYSDYDYYIKNYKLNFSKVYVISVEKINKNPQKELNKIMKFLDLKNHKFNLNVLKHETKNQRKSFRGTLPYLRRKIYIRLIEIIYKIISWTVRGKSVPDA